MKPSTGEQNLMDKTFVRNYALFFLTLTICAGSLIYILISGERDIGKTDDQVQHTHDVIAEAEQLATLIEAMLAAQRGFIITGDKEFLQKYRDGRDNGSDRIASLNELVSDNKSQASRLDELRHHFNEFSTHLEERTERFAPMSPSEVTLEGVEVIDNLKSNILRINSSMLEEEYGILNDRIKVVEKKKSTYFITLLVGLVVASALLLLFNGFLLRAQRKRSYVEASLKDTEERFALAIEGTQDGIFDWDLITGEVFYSRRFFSMLGYERESMVGTTDDFKDLIHPEDTERVWQYIEQYLDNKLSEYSQDFRLKGQNGRWVWINARAKAIFGVSGKPVRMVGAHTDISHMKESEERLKSEKVEAEKANEAKGEFLAHMSHEIRTPLTAISGIAEIFEAKQDNFDAKQKKLVGTLHNSVSILKDLINDILDYSKIESQELELEEEVFALDAAFEELVSMMAVRANEKGVSFVFDYNDLKDINFYGDKTRLRQILINLIGNGLKFTEEGGVTVKAYKENREAHDFLRIDVTDTGIGIAPEDFDLVFERFKQADSSVSRKYGGTGLGLPISKNLAKLMGGNIILSSEPDHGSTFSVLLPMKTEGEIAKTDNQDVLQKLNDKLKASIDGENKILMVEDYEGNVVVISYILEEMGLEFDVANTGKEGLELWKKNHYDIILMDIQMPEMDGFTATKTIREQEQEKDLPRTPIIGMTAHALVGDKDKCIAAGMDAYLPKPIVESDLKKEILKFLGKSKKKKAA